MADIVTDISVNKNWNARKGANNPVTFTFTQNSVAFDITTYTFSVQLRKFGSSANLLNLTEGSGVTNNGAAGTLNVVFTSGNLTNLVANDYYWQMTVVHPDTFNYLWFQGTFNLFSETYTGDLTTAVAESIDINGTTINTAITLGVGGGSDYTPSGPTTATVGGIASGTDLGVSDITFQALLDDILYPAVTPSFSSFSVSGQSTTIEVGTTLSGSKTFTWAISVGTGTVSTIDIYDNTATATLLAGTPNDGSQAQNITSIQLNSNGVTQSWKGIANNTNPVQTIDSSNFVVTARFYRFFGPTASSPANSADVRALASSAFQTTGSFNLTTGTTLTKFVVALPPSVTISSVIDLDALNADITSEYVLTGTVNVLDAGSTNRAYNIYEMNIGVAYSTSHRHQITI
jgi:hypothetical protein